MPAYPPPTGPEHGRQYPSDEDGDGPNGNEVEGITDTETFAADGRVGPGHGRQYPSDEDGDGPNGNEAGGIADTETFAAGGCVPNDAPTGADAGRGVECGHVDLADTGNIMLTTAGMTGVLPYEETR